MKNLKYAMYRVEKHNTRVLICRFIYKPGPYTIDAVVQNQVFMCTATGIEQSKTIYKVPNLPDPRYRPLTSWRPVNPVLTGYQGIELWAVCENIRDIRHRLYIDHPLFFRE